MKRVVCLLLIFCICLCLLPVCASAAETLTERQQAVVQVALAYYDRGHSVQYDGTSFVPDIPREDGGRTRSTNQEAPEYATPNETLYSVCSDFVHQVYWEAFRYQLCGSAGNMTTMNFVDKNVVSMLHLYDKTEGKDVKEEIRKMFTLAQPGDVFTTYSTAGHAMIYLGELFGDGVKYLAHCYGNGIRINTGKDIREYAPDDPDFDWRYDVKTYSDSSGGAIRLTPNAEEYFLKTYGKDSYVKISLVRPLSFTDFTAERYPITAATKYRMAHPRLSIERTLNKTRFLSAVTGETLTLTLKLSNHSKTGYTVPVTEKVPEGVTLKKAAEGATVADGLIKWDVQLDAGAEKTFTITYEVTAVRGATLDFSGSSVGDIPSNCIPITVGGKKLTAEETAKLAAIANGDYDAVLKACKATDLGDAVYQKVLGLKPELPKPKQLIENLTEPHVFSDKSEKRTVKTADRIAEADAFAYRMLVPMFHGGKGLWKEWGHERCNDPRDMHVEPGDVIYRVPDLAKPEAYDTLICLGGGKYLRCDAARKNPCVIAEEPELVKSLTYQAMFNLRPTLAYDDLHTQTCEASAPTAYRLPFSDVKASDWFFPYVRDLVREGVVNGMTPTAFEPNGSLTYGQALKLIALAVGEAEPQKTGGHWASGYLSLAREQNWLDGKVDLDAKITRVQLCGIAAKAKKLTKKPQTNPFKDTEDANVLALCCAKVINGMTADSFAPDALLTRAQISKIVWELRRVRMP